MAKPTKHQIALAIIELSKTVAPAKLAESIAAYIIAERRSGELDAIMREVKRLREQQTGTVEVNLTTAFPATSAVKAQVKQLLGNGPIVLNETVDKSVIGGVRVETNDYYLDLTVRNRLNKLKLGVTK